MYQLAIERYTSVASHLDEKRIDYTIYPQGSFAFGTVVRPFRNGNWYDLEGSQDAAAHHVTKVHTQVVYDKQQFALSGH